MRKQRPCGFTLLEIMIVVLLTGIIMLMVSRLTNATFQSLRFLREKAQTLQSATLGLERLASEMREAISVDSLSPLTFRKVNPTAPEALGNPVNDPDTGANWVRDYSSDFNGDNQIGQVTYSLDVPHQILSRTVSFEGVTQTLQVATRVNDFIVERSPVLGTVSTTNDVFSVTLSVQEDRRVLTFRTVLSIPGLQS